jgi:hypothetical protein
VVEAKVDHVEETVAAHRGCNPLSCRYPVRRMYNYHRNGKSLNQSYEFLDIFPNRGLILTKIRKIGKTGPKIFNN